MNPFLPPCPQSTYCCSGSCSGPTRIKQAELLQRRIADSHERTAAVELLDLREALKKEGFTPRNDTRPVAVRKDQTAKEQIPRRSLRPTRQTRQRLSVGQRLTKMARDFQDWTQRQTTIEPPRPQVRQRRGISI